jgi:hypothetical protein
VIASGGLIGGAEAMQAAPSAVASLPPPGHIAKGTQDSFAEVMQQRTQADAVKPEAKPPDVKDIVPGGIGSKEKTAEGTQHATAFSLDKTAELARSIQEKKQLSGDDNAQGNEESQISAEDIAAKPETKVLTKSADVSFEGEAAANVAKTIGPAAAIASFKPAVNDAPITTMEKLPVEEREKAKSSVVAKVSAHPVAKNAQSSGIPVADDGGTVMVSPVANAVIEGAATGGTKQTTTASFAIASSATAAVAAGDKSTNGKTSQIVGASAVASATGPVANSADAVALPNASTESDGVVSGSQGSSVGVVATTALQSVIWQTTDISTAQVHTVQGQELNPLPASTVARSVQAGAVAAHSQPGGSGDLTLSPYDTGKPSQLEVGLQGGGLGWLKVRAELTNTGEVNAYIRGSSADSASLLQMQVPKIEAYLGAQDVAVRSVQVETAQMHTPGAGVGGDGNAASDNGAAQPQSRRSNRGSDAGMDALTSVDAIDEEVMPSQMVMNQNSIAMTGTGNWLSVRA